MSQHQVREFISLSDMTRQASAIASMAPWDTRVVIGSARSGLAPAGIIASLLHLPLVSLSQSEGDIVECGNGFRLRRGQHVRAGSDERALLVDDTIFGGTSMQKNLQVAKESFSRVTTAACYTTMSSPIRPDIYGRVLESPHILEWNFMNCVQTQFLAVDFDGVLCENPTWDQDDDGPKYLDFIRNAMPKYIPRLCPVPLIVTARIERYREETVKWLDKHKVKYRKLVMHPADTLQERNNDCISTYKANHFKKWKEETGSPMMEQCFVESEPSQAIRISRISGATTICPRVAGVFREGEKQ